MGRLGPNHSGTTPPLVPEWDDPALTRLARQLRDAHRRVAVLPATERPRLTRQLLVITDLAKRDPQLACRRLEIFLAGLDPDLDLDPELDAE